MKRNYRIEAESIIDALGGKDNIISASHCMTRLIFTLEKEELVSIGELEAVSSVLRSVRANGSLFAVVGNDASRLYSEILSLGIKEERGSAELFADTYKRSNRFTHLLSFVSDCMAPLIPAMLGGGMIKVLTVILSAFELLPTESTTYSLLLLIGDAFFYFLPIMLAYSTATRIGSSRVLAMLVAAVLLHPELTNLFAKGSVDFLGITVTNTVYSSGVLPILILVPVMKYIENFADRVSPNLIKGFFKPFLTVLISAPIALIVIGPIGSLLGSLLADIINLLYARVGWLAVALLAAAMPFIKLCGMQYSLIPLAAVHLSSFGYDSVIIVAMFCSVLAQSGASFATALVVKDKSAKEIAAGSGLSAIISGVTEPALYGVTMRYKAPLAAACISAGIAGALAGLSGVAVYISGGAPSVFTLIQMINGEDLSSFTAGLLTLAAVLILSFSLTLIFWQRNKLPVSEEDADTLENSTKNPKDAIDPVTVSSTLETVIPITSPLSGSLVSLSDIQDKTFASEILGKGCAVIPTDGHLYSPINGRIISFQSSCNSLTLTSDDGVELLIHIGIDTLSLGEKYFTLHREEDERIGKGDLILSFDLSAMEDEGYDTATPIIITNCAAYSKIDLPTDEFITAGDLLMTLHKEEKRFM